MVAIDSNISDKKKAVEMSLMDLPVDAVMVGFS